MAGPEIRGELELYNQWFAIADLDKDGVLSGPEAVQFFLRSGLPQNPTLFKVRALLQQPSTLHWNGIMGLQADTASACAGLQIWQYVAGERPSLSRQEFYTAMKLVALAQVRWRCPR
jgi:epidermal growth factor receptor substrate 15